MAEYLTPEQKAEFLKNLESQGGVPDGGALSPEEQQQAMQEGAQMAAADAQNGQLPEAGGPEAAQTETQAGVDGAVLSQLGFTSLDELANAYRETLRTKSEMEGLLTELTAMQKAMENEDELGDDQESQIRKVLRSDFKPMYDRMKADARNRVVQEAWKKSAEGKSDLSELMGDIQAYLAEHSDLSMMEDGLDRAYHAVRSGKYRSEGALLSDPEFLKKVMDNPEVKKGVIEKYLQEVSRQGEAAPQTISDGGNTPLTAKKTASGMEQAKAKLAAMLGVK